MVTSTSKSDYHGGMIALRRNFQQGFMLQGAYTFGRAMDDADLAVGTTAYQDAADIQADRAVAGYDAAHKVSIVGLWELPFFRNGSGLTQTLLGGWQLAGSASCRAGRRSTSPPARRSRAGLQRRRQRRRSSERARRRHQDERLEQGRIPERHLPGVGLPDAAPGENGNLPRNAYRGPGYVDVSLSLSKKFRVQRWSGEFRLDAFNAFNRVNLADPTMDLSSTNFGR